MQLVEQVIKEVKLKNPNANEEKVRRGFEKFMEAYSNEALNGVDFDYHINVGFNKEVKRKQDYLF